MNEVLLAVHAAGVPILTFAWVIPLVLAVLVPSLPAAKARVGVAVTGAAAVFLVSVESLRVLSSGEYTGFILEDQLGYGGFGYHVGLDGLGSIFLTIANLLALLATVYGWLARKDRASRWQAWVFTLQASLNGMILSLDFALFAAFALLEILPTFRLVDGWGTGEARGAAARRAARFLFASAFLWVCGTVVLVVVAGVGTDLAALESRHLEGPWVDVAFFLLLYALAVRLPLFPFHAWLPPVIEHGPIVALNVLLLGLKIGAFGLVRFVLPVLPDPAVRYTDFIVAIGIAGMLYGALIALAQSDLRRMLAYVSLSHMGLVVPGLLTLDTHGVEGALLEALNLGLASAALYFLVGFLYRRTGTTDLSQLRGIAAGLPMLATAFLVVTLATIGMPGTAGAEALHLILEAEVAQGHYITAVAVGAGTVLGGASLLRAYQFVLVAPDEAMARHVDLSKRELAIAGSLCLLIVLVGVYTAPWVGALAGPSHLVDDRAHHEPVGANLEAPTEVHE